MSTADIRNTTHRFADVAREPCITLTPIDGFSKYPLVTLEEAVVPLKTIVPRLSAYVYTAKQRATNPADNLSRDESAAIILYTMEWGSYTESLYYILNNTLRTEDRKNLIPWFLYLKLILTGLSRLPSVNLCVYRGVRNEIPGENENYQLGKNIFWWGFSSCSKDRKIAQKENFVGEAGRKTLFIIESLKGKDISKHSYFKEAEILLLPATKVQVTRREYEGNNLHVIYLEEIESSLDYLESVSSVEEIINLKNISNTIQSGSLPQPPSSQPRSGSTISESNRYSNPKLSEQIARSQIRSEVILTGKRFNENDIELIVEQLITGKECRELFLRESGVTSKGAGAIARGLNGNKTLQRLFLSHNTIGDGGAIALARSLCGNNNVTLKLLFLGNNDITDVGVDHIAEMLKSNRTLTHLGLPSNKITDLGLKKLAAVIANTNRTLQVLALEWNQFRSDSSVDILIDMLENSPSLTKLSLNSCKLSRSAIKKLKTVAKSKKNFDLKIH